MSDVEDKRTRNETLKRDPLLLVTFPDIEEAAYNPEVCDNIKEHLLSRDSIAEFSIEGLETKIPTCTIGRYEFVGRYEHMLGSQMYFSVTDPKEEKRNVKFEGLGKKRLVMRLKSYTGGGKKRKVEEEVILCDGDDSVGDDEDNAQKPERRRRIDKE